MNTDTKYIYEPIHHTTPYVGILYSSVNQEIVIENIYNMYKMYCTIILQTYTSLFVLF